MDRELISFTYMHSNSILMLKKSDRYFRMVEPILRQNGIPDDLKYLMAIESNLNPKAYSSAGAAGLWQFTKTTGKEYGLIIDAEVDERYNIEKETVAACKYLRRATRGRNPPLIFGWSRRPLVICSGCFPPKCFSRLRPLSGSM